MFKDQIEGQYHSVQGAIQLCLKGIAILVECPVLRGRRAISFEGRLRVNGNFSLDLQLCVRGICVQGRIFFGLGAIVFKGRLCSRGNRVQGAIVFKGQLCSRGNFVLVQICSRDHFVSGSIVFQKECG